MGSAGYAIVPVIGGLALILGGIAALYVDRLDLLSLEETPKPVLIRYTSQATYALDKRPHWIFLASAVVFAPLLMVTAVWQAALAEEFFDDNPEKSQQLQDDLRLFAFLCGPLCVLLAAWPMGNILGTVVHTLLAAGFAVTGFNYSFRTKELANERGDDGLATARLALTIMGLVGAASTIIGLYPAVTATIKLQEHEEGTKHLDTAQIRTERIKETFVAVGQVVSGFMVGSVLLTAAAEVGDVDSSISNVDDNVWIVGVATLAGGTAVAVVARLCNSFAYNLCQAKQHDDGDDDDGGDDKEAASGEGKEMEAVVDTDAA